MGGLEWLGFLQLLLGGCDIIVLIKTMNGGTDSNANTHAYACFFKAIDFQAGGLTLQRDAARCAALLCKLSRLLGSQWF